MQASRFLSRLLLPLVFASCTTTDDGTIEVEPPPEEEPQLPEPMPHPDPNETPAQAAQRVMGQFKDCMKFADFQTANMANAWASLAATNNQQCRSCHVTGGNGFIATDQAQLMFDTIKTNQYYLLQFVVADLTAGPSYAKVIVNRESFRGVGLGKVPHAEHPRFNPDANAGMTALQRFYDLTMARIVAECSPSPQ